MKKFSVDQVHSELNTSRACYLGALFASIKGIELQDDEVKKCVSICKRLNALGATNTPAYNAAKNIYMEEQIKEKKYGIF